MIGEVVRDGLCTNCGTCVSICPFRAIFIKKKEINFEIRVDKKKCQKCGLCRRVCPGREVNFGQLTQKIFGKDKKLNYSSYLGYFKNCFLGYSKDEKLRYLCSSGGLITSLLVYLLKNKIVDGVLVTGMDLKKPLISNPFIAYTKEEVLEARGSKYTPVVLNQCLREIVESKKKTFAVVGLPCHIQGIRKWQRIYPLLKNKIKYTFGLFCGQEVNFLGTKLILKILNVNPKEVRKIEYRGGGWPGKIVIYAKNGKIFERRFPEIFKIFNLGFFTTPRCFLCTDFTNELADISFGDAWISDLIKKGKGFNFVISRTLNGEDLLKKARKYIYLKKIEPSLIIKTDKIKFLTKKDSYGLIKKIRMMEKKLTPKYKPEVKLKTNLISLPYIIFYLISLITSLRPRFFLKIPNFFWNFEMFLMSKIKKFLS